MRPVAVARRSIARAIDRARFSRTSSRCLAHLQKRVFVPKNSTAALYWTQKLAAPVRLAAESAVPILLEIGIPGCPGCFDQLAHLFTGSSKCIKIGLRWLELSGDIIPMVAPCRVTAMGVSAIYCRNKAESPEPRGGLCAFLNAPARGGRFALRRSCGRWRPMSRLAESRPPLESLRDPSARTRGRFRLY